jgi:uncharacterized protein YqhQ
MANETEAIRPRGIAEEGELFATHIGGSAVIEGVMMRGKLSWAVAVRQPNGTIYVEEHDLEHPANPSAGLRDWRRWPVVRGCVSFVESMALSFRAMGVASEHAYEPDDEPLGQDAADGLAPWMAGSVVLGTAIGLALFVVAPAALTNLVLGDYSSKGALLWNLVDAGWRVAIFIGYIVALRLMPDMLRVFRYHGAEHETIHCYEHGEPLTPENAARYSCLHVRCGTAFVIMVMIVAIVVNTLIPVDALVAAWGITTGIGRFLVVVLSRVVMIPLVAGLAYEVTVRWAGSHPENPLVRVLLAPGLAMQRLTTAPPDAGQLECAIRALELVDARERREAAG